MKKIVICVPNYSGVVDFQWAAKLFNMVKPEGYEFDLFSVKDCKKIDFIRNAAIRYAIDSNAEYILFIDDDNFVNNNTLMNLMFHDVNCVAAISRLRDNTGNLSVYERTDEGLKSMQKVEEGLIQVAATGFPCVLIKRQMFKKMADEFDGILFFHYNTLTQEITEDIYFCGRAKELGFKIMVDTTERLRHDIYECGDEIYIDSPANEGDGEGETGDNGTTIER